MRTAKLLVVAAVGAMLAVPALAQGRGGEGGEGRPPGRQGQQRFEQARLSEEDREAAWKLQAVAFGAGQNLSKEQTDKLAETYIEIRRSHASESDALRTKMRESMQERMRDREGGGEGGGGAGGGEDARAAMAEMREQIQKIDESHREKLQTALKEQLTGETLEKATKLFSIFNPQWDAVAHTIRGFELGDEATYVALWPVEAYFVKVHELRSDPGDDARAAGAKIQEARQELSEQLDDLLSEEQMRQVDRALGRGMRGGRGGGGGGGGFDRR